MNFVLHITLLPHSGKKLYAKPKPVSHTPKEDMKVGDGGGLLRSKASGRRGKGQERGTMRKAAQTYHTAASKILHKIVSEIH